MVRYQVPIEPSAVRDRFPHLVTVTHHFAKIQSNGLPEPEYNRNLLEFDHDIRTTVEQGEFGITVLIETFCGKRHYYIYVASENSPEEALAGFMKLHPTEKISWASPAGSRMDFLVEVLY